MILHNLGFIPSIAMMTHCQLDHCEKKYILVKKQKQKNKSYNEDESEIILSRLSAYMFKPRSMC